MELGTLGAVLKFALDIENRACSFYELACSATTNPNLVAQFEELVQRGQKRIETLMRIRREHTTEMILEPITGLNSDTYNPITAIPEGGDEGTLQLVAVAIETELRDFYTAAAIKIGFLSEVAYSFEQLADENSEAIQHLSRGF
ncbi:MAG: hypothetical protein AM324_001785 [Candidatus Thorarchaeota archaeon SMTZ1-83]|nr:MAG: hypothetical protein AM324_02695 [Candidatus Thorarchaeota archaeon SMTZ1-83]